MHKFRVNQRVIVRAAPPGVNESDYPKIGVVTKVPPGVGPHPEWYFIRFASRTWRVPEELMSLAPYICPVCNKKVKIVNGHADQHGTNVALCYGSFLPGEE